MNHWCKTKSELNDFIAFVVLYGPNDFPAWRNMTMEKAFAEITAGLELFAKDFKTTDDASTAKRLAAQSEAAYSSGEINKGAHLLQELAELL